MKYIAVVYTHSREEVLNWLVEEHFKSSTIVNVNYIRGTVELNGEKTYILINSVERAIGFVFEDVIVSPFYLDLVAQVRQRIR